MATFQIHEDIENYPNGLGKSKNILEKLVPDKKACGERRAVLQPVNNGTRQDSKRVKLSSKNEQNAENLEPIAEIKSEQSENETHLENDFLQVNEAQENDDLNLDDAEKEKFPKELLHVLEYREDIKEYLHQLEKQCPFPKPSYMIRQSDLNWSTRSILIDWLASVAEEYNMGDLTFHLGVNYIDRFLSQIAVVRSKFQLLGATAMMVAAKVEEIYPLEPKEWSYLTGDAFSVRQILKMEQLILKVLKFKMQPPTICTFIQHIGTQLQLDQRTMNLASYIAELVLLEGEDYFNYSSSKLAAASIAFARFTLSKQKLWPKQLKEASGYSLKQLSPVVRRQHKTFRDSPLKEQQAIQSKYKSEKYDKVALIKPRVLRMEILEGEE